MSADPQLGVRDGGFTEAASPLTLEYSGGVVPCQLVILRTCQAAVVAVPAVHVAVLPSVPVAILYQTPVSPTVPPPACSLSTVQPLGGVHVPAFLTPTEAISKSPLAMEAGRFTAIDVTEVPNVVVVAVVDEGNAIRVPYLTLE